MAAAGAANVEDLRAPALGDLTATAEFRAAASAAEYGATLAESTVQKARKSTSFVTVLLGLLLPIVVFVVVHAVLSFALYFEIPRLAQFICAVCIAMVLGMGFVGFSKFKAEAIGEREMSWYMFLVVTGIAAWLFAVCLGLANFRANSLPYYLVVNMNSYKDLDPAFLKGQQMMDLGTIQFTENARIDTTRPMSFTNKQTYCVAPIVSSSSSDMNIDLWAVGVDCCGSGNERDFTCQGASNPSVHSAVRVMEQPDEDFFRLAVTQAEAAYGFKSAHPVFLRWAADPRAALNRYMQRSAENFVKGFLGFGVAQFVAWTLFIIGMSKS